jgi:hypothetical protein
VSITSLPNNKNRPRWTSLFQFSFYHFLTQVQNWYFQLIFQDWYSMFRIDIFQSDWYFRFINWYFNNWFFPIISKMKTIQSMSFAYKIICLVIVFGNEDETEWIEYLKESRWRKVWLLPRIKLCEGICVVLPLHNHKFCSLIWLPEIPYCFLNLHIYFLKLICGWLLLLLRLIVAVVVVKIWIVDHIAIPWNNK